MIELYKQPNTGKSPDGLTLAACNNPANTVTLDEVKAARTEPISKEAFTVMFTYFCEMHDRKLSDVSIKIMYSDLNAAMGHDEFIAAAEDARREQLRFSDIPAYLIDHVTRQREAGHDLLELAMRDA